MIKNKFTPGPWVRLDTGKLIQSYSGPYVCLVLASDFTVEQEGGITFGSKNDCNEAFHNAALISAAPEMLSLLESIKDHLLDDRELAASIRMVIKKARGE